jgi:tetratricopeptide (TPR) repeat protein
MQWVMLLLVGLLPIACPVKAQDDDDGGEVKLTPDMQWRMAITAWDRREFDDSAVLLVTYATMNPDDANVLDAWWRAYEVYRAYRPKPERRKETYEKAIAVCVRWEGKYAQTDKNRAAQAMWYHALLFERELGRAAAITELKDLITRYPDAGIADQARWHAAEWLREAQRYREAITYYQDYRKSVGITDLSGAAAYREGWCYEELKDKENAIASYRTVIDEPKYNWGWWNVGWGGLDTAERLKRLGEEQLARAYAMAVLDKCPEWSDIKIRARQFLGMNVTSAKKMWIHPHIYPHWTTDRVNLEGGAKIPLVLNLALLLRMSGVTKETPFKGTFSVTPKIELSKTKDQPNTMQEVLGDDGKKSYTIDVVSPDANGNPVGDQWFWLTQVQDAAPLPEAVIITRKWEKMGKTWGESTIRVQFPGRWHFYITLPNALTSPDNVTGSKPNDVQNKGMTFHWNDWYDLSQGVTIKFPVEVGANVNEYYPKIYLQRWFTPATPDKSGAGTEATYEIKEYSVSLKSDTAFPYTFTCPTLQDITLNEISR